MRSGHFTLATGTSNPFVVDLQRNNMHTKIFLVGYSIIGAPVTGNVPNNAFYNIIFENVPVKNTDWSRNDGLFGIPLPLTGNFTYNQFNPPLQLWHTELPVSLNKFSIRATDDNNQPAVFDKMTASHIYHVKIT